MGFAVYLRSLVTMVTGINRPLPIANNMRKVVKNMTISEAVYLSGASDGPFIGGKCTGKMAKPAWA